MSAAPATAAGVSAEIELARAEMFTALVEELNRAAITYCLLSGHQSYPAAPDGDVDIMVHPQEAKRVPSLLRAVAQRCDAMLVQGIQHETSACYFVLAKAAENGIPYLHPDVATDYRRNGRLWLRAGQVLSRRMKCGSFFAAAVEDEFVYYLIKKVLKGAIDGNQLLRLRSLYLAAPAVCRERLWRFWPEGSINGVISAVAGCDLLQFREQMPRLFIELQGADRVESRGSRVVQSTREVCRVLKRVIQPTGFTVELYGGSGQERDRLATEMEQRLRPAFRRTRIVTRDGIALRLWEWVAVRRSTLVIRRVEGTSIGRRGDRQAAFVASHDPEAAAQSVLGWMAQCIAGPEGFGG